jgi:hypothetical protein
MCADILKQQQRFCLEVSCIKANLHRLRIFQINIVPPVSPRLQVLYVMWEKVLCRLPKFAYTLKSAAAVALNYDERVLKFQLNAAAAMAKEESEEVCAPRRASRPSKTA